MNKDTIIESIKLRKSVRTYDVNKQIEEYKITELKKYFKSISTDPPVST